MSTQPNTVNDERDIPEEFRGNEVERGAPYEFKKGIPLIGTLVRLKVLPGKREGTTFHVAHVVDDDGVQYAVSAGAILGDLLSGVLMDSRVRIEYLGDIPTPRGPAKNFRVHAVPPK